MQASTSLVPTKAGTVFLLGLQKKLETREQLEIDSFFSSAQDQLGNK
jgi:hypothetical protein